MTTPVVIEAAIDSETQPNARASPLLDVLASEVRRRLDLCDLAATDIGGPDAEGLRASDFFEKSVPRIPLERGGHLHVGLAECLHSEGEERDGPLRAYGYASPPSMAISSPSP